MYCILKPNEITKLVEETREESGLFDPISPKYSIEGEVYHFEMDMKMYISCNKSPKILKAFKNGKEVKFEEFKNPFVNELKDNTGLKSPHNFKIGDLYFIGGRNRYTVFSKETMTVKGIYAATWKHYAHRTKYRDSYGGESFDSETGRREADWSPAKYSYNMSIGMNLIVNLFANLLVHNFGIYYYDQPYKFDVNYDEKNRQTVEIYQPEIETRYDERNVLEDRGFLNLATSYLWDYPLSIVRYSLDINNNHRTPEHKTVLKEMDNTVTDVLLGDIKKLQLDGITYIEHEPPYKGHDKQVIIATWYYNEQGKEGKRPMQQGAVLTSFIRFQKIENERNAGETFEECAYRIHSRNKKWKSFNSFEDLQYYCKKLSPSLVIKKESQQYFK